MDYKEFLTVLRDELDRSLKPLKEDIREVRTAQENTYSREMMDSKLQTIVDEVKRHDDDLKGIHRLIGNSGRELLERIGVIASIAYALVYVLPHLIH